MKHYGLLYIGFPQFVKADISKHVGHLAAFTILKELHENHTNAKNTTIHLASYGLAQQNFMADMAHKMGFLVHYHYKDRQSADTNFVHVLTKSNDPYLDMLNLGDGLLLPYLFIIKEKEVFIEDNYILNITMYGKVSTIIVNY